MKLLNSKLETRAFWIPLMVLLLGCSITEGTRPTAVAPFSEPAVAVRMDDKSGGFSFVTCFQARCAASVHSQDSSNTRGW